MKKIIIPIIIIALFAVGYIVMMEDEAVANAYESAKISRGDIFSKITSTGTLEAVTTVEVGTQVSGKIEKIFYDFNDKVKANTLLAVLDTTFLSASVKDAEANLARMEALSEEADKKFELARELYTKQMISELDYISAKTTAKTAAANLQSAKSTLERQKTNLEYAFIKSPITGTIISRNVEEGQTVAASLQAPTLFTIAKDLAQMQILADVDESDIGEIKKGQRVTFTVPAYWEKEFSGIVQQIRLQPNVVSNVVNYTVVIDASNESGVLLPGMTATIDFFVKEAINVLRLPSAALNFKPDEETLQKLIEERRKKREEISNDEKSPGLPGGIPVGRSKRTGNNNNTGNPPKQIWFLDSEQKLDMRFVRLGINDGKYYEIIGGRGVEEGMEIIVSSKTEKLQTNSEHGFGPPRGMGGPF